MGFAIPGFPESRDVPSYRLLKPRGCLQTDRLRYDRLRSDRLKTDRSLMHKPTYITTAAYITTAPTK